jgi:hypothetical protein
VGAGAAERHGAAGAGAGRRSGAAAARHRESAAALRTRRLDSTADAASGVRCGRCVRSSRRRWACTAPPALHHVWSSGNRC